MNYEELLDDLADVSNYGEVAGSATNMLATGMEWEDVANELMNEFGLSSREATAMAILMADDGGEFFGD